jgi:misacylated tRNA(Ala) deacylase
MTDLLYMKDIDSNYIREFDAAVVRRKDDYVVLDRSAFYPEGGGQPSDTGTLLWGDTTSTVTHVTKKGIVKHHLDGEVPGEGVAVRGVLDWERRYAHMQMHTAQHVISGVVYDRCGARTVGNQIHAEYSRVDFRPAAFSDEDVADIERDCNRVLERDAPVRIYEEKRAVLEERVDQQRCNLDLLPKSISRLRIIEIEGFDLCPCAGTHVRATGEIPRLAITKRESKGKDTLRLVYRLG